VYEEFGVHLFYCLFLFVLFLDNENIVHARSSTLVVERVCELFVGFIVVGGFLLKKEEFIKITFTISVTKLAVLFTSKLRIKTAQCNRKGLQS